MPVTEKKYPDWVQKYRTRGKTVKKKVESDKKKISLTDIEVWEYGFSKAILDLCPEGWKRLWCQAPLNYYKLLPCLERSRPMPISRGNITAAPMPIRMLPPLIVVMKPAAAGPPAHPRSPARARRANIRVPPFFRLAAARLKVPGQKMPTEKPARPKPRRAISGWETRAMTR